MVGTLERRHHTRHRRVAAILARRAIAQVSPVRDRDRIAEGRRLARDQRRRARAALLREMREVLGFPQPYRRRRQPQPQQVDRDAPIVLSSDSSAEDQGPPPILVDLDSSVESLPNIDPRPQWQLPVQPLPDLGPLDVDAELLQPLQHQTFREAVVLLERLQLPVLQPFTPPPELPQQPPTPPPEQLVDWVCLEAEVASLDGQQCLVLPSGLTLQQPDVVALPQHVPGQFVAPPPMQQVDWAAIAKAIFMIEEREGNQPQTN